MEETRDRVISIRDLNITFDTANGTVHAIRGMRLDLFRGETVAIVGESGSGKSVTAKAIMGISSKNQHIVSGSILYSYRDANNELHTMDIAKMSEREIRRKVCGRHVAMVFQDPMTSLNPTMTIGKQIMEGMLEYSSMTKAEAKPSTCCGTWASSTPNSGSNSTPTSFRAACGSVWSSPLRCPATPTC